MAPGEGRHWQGARKGFQAVPTQPPLPPDQQEAAASGGHRPGVRAGQWRGLDSPALPGSTHRTLRSLGPAGSRGDAGPRFHGGAFSAGRQCCRLETGCFSHELLFAHRAAAPGGEQSSA